MFIVADRERQSERARLRQRQTQRLKHREREIQKRRERERKSGKDGERVIVKVVTRLGKTVENEKERKKNTQTLHFSMYLRWVFGVHCFL